MDEARMETVESKIRKLLADNSAGFVTLNYYGPWKLVLVYKIDDKYFEAESEVVKTDKVTQEQLGALHEISLRNSVECELHNQREDEIRSQGNPGDPLSAETAYLQRTVKENEKIERKKTADSLRKQGLPDHAAIHEAAPRFKRCPFCGSAPETHLALGGFLVECRCENNAMTVSAIHKDLEKLIELWNGRA